MYAIVDVQGKQYKIKKGDVIEVERIEKKEGEKIKLDKVLLYRDDHESLIGQPYLNNIKIEAEVLGEKKGKKVIAFKYKRRKGYHRKVGHRQIFTRLKINEMEKKS